MDKLSSLIPRVLNKRGLRDEASASHVTYLSMLWIQENLPDCSQYLVVSKHSAAVLHVESDHSIASQELSQVSQALLDYLNSHDGISIDDIRISRGTGSRN